MQIDCVACEKQFRLDDVCPLIKEADETIRHICRKCLARWIGEGFLQNIPFWKRKELHDAL